MKEFNTCAGVPLHYSRDTVYGTKGRQHSFQGEEHFHTQLEECFTELWSYPCGKAEIIVTAGVLVKKEGYHGEGRAIDIDCIFWNGLSLVTRRDGYKKENLPLYLGVEAVLCRHFGTVLNYDYVNHDDHFHVDNGKGNVLFDPAWKDGSMIAFLQALLTHVFKIPVGTKRYEGQKEDQEFNRSYDAPTKAALDQAMKELGMTETHEDLATLEVWRAFLKHAAGKCLNEAFYAVEASRH